jgi:hypothetical protein
LSNQHQNDFYRWIQRCLPEVISLAGELHAEPLTGDAGFRRYYRLNTQPSLIAVDSPPSKEKNLEYVNISMALQAHGLRTPVIYAVDFSQGFMLLEDFGDQLLQPLLNSHSVTALYTQAEARLLDIQQLPASTDIFPHYDAEQLQAEMLLFNQWFVTKLLGLNLEQQEIELLDSLYQQLILSAQQQPQVPVHRDYHSRNLMLLNDGELGIIDFQDAVQGPITYDLVSLLKDCYVRWPAPQMRERAINFKHQAQRLNQQLDVSDQQFIRWFDFMGLQRHIKVMGIFARLALRDGKEAYLRDLPLVIHYSLEAAGQYSECHAFYSWFQQRISPLLSAQDWYQPLRDETL